MGCALPASADLYGQEREVGKANRAIRDSDQEEGSAMKTRKIKVVKPTKAEPTKAELRRASVLTKKLDAVSTALKKMDKKLNKLLHDIDKFEKEMDGGLNWFDDHDPEPDPVPVAPDGEEAET